MKFKLEQVAKNVYHIHFNRQLDLTSTFVRLSEYYESPRFRGKVFTINEFKKWYIETSGKKKFTYYKDVSGFNIPSVVFRAFASGKFDPLSKKEKFILNLFKDKKNKFCVIGTYSEKGDNLIDTLHHEIAHGLFYTNRKYRLEVQSLLKRYDLSVVNEFLKKQGYSKAVWLDEAHAFIMCDLNVLRTSDLKVTRKYMQLHKKLNDIFKKYYAEVENE